MKKRSSLQKIEVIYCPKLNPMKVGSLIQRGNEIYFRYDKEFLSKNLNLSPFKINFNTDVQKANDDPFDGLFGVFADSLPDGWGRLLLDRFLITKNQEISSLSPLDRLAYVGSGGAGALEFTPSYSDSIEEQKVETFLEEYAQAAIEILDGEHAILLENFYRHGGTSGGARPKMEIYYSESEDKIKPSFGELETGYESWLVKFPSTHDLPDIANVEYAYAQMAKAAGIRMSKCKLLPSSKGNQHFFATKRFDRNGVEKIHKHSVAGLLHDDFRKSNLDYGHIMDAAFQLQKDRKVYEQILRLAAFNVFTSNQDDHSKNFSFLMEENGDWDFAPAYDLTFSPSMYNFHSMAIAGVQQNVQRKNLMDLSNHFDVKNGLDIISDVYDTVQNWKSYAKDAGVSSLTIKTIQGKIESIK